MLEFAREHWATALFFLILAFAGVREFFDDHVRDVDSVAFCEGYRFAWPRGYCGYDDDCSPPDTPECPPPPAWRWRNDPALVIGVRAGLDDGAASNVALGFDGQ